MQYRVNATTSASVSMKGLTDGLPAMVCVFPVLDGDGVGVDQLEDVRGPL